MTVTVSVNTAVVDSAAKRAFKETAFLVGREFTKSISSNIWDWPKGQSPRDVVDNGQLRASQQLVFLSDTRAEFSWNTDYAYYVHEGYTLANGVEMPARDWTRHGLEQIDIPGTMARLAERYTV
ncbi:MAG: hypothetical protein ACR2FS_15250 [Phormidesmis sp.]